MVRTLDTDSNIYGRASGTAGRTARRTRSQRTAVQRTTAQGTASRSAAAQRTTAQGTASRSAAAQKTTAQRTASRSAAGQRTTAQRTATRSAAGQGTVSRTTTAQRPSAQETNTRARVGKPVRIDDRGVQKRRNDKAVKTIEPAGRGVRVDEASISAADSEIRVPRSAMSFQTVIVMLALIAVMTVILVFYITLQSEVTETSQLIADKEQTLTQLKAENDASYNDINDSISLEEVRRRAIQDLGMKYADRNQVVIYTGTEKDSVHQVSSLSDN